MCSCIVQYHSLLNTAEKCRLAEWFGCLVAERWLGAGGQGQGQSAAVVDGAQQQAAMVGWDDGAYTQQQQQWPIHYDPAVGGPATSAQQTSLAAHLRRADAWVLVRDYVQYVCCCYYCYIRYCMIYILVYGI